MCFVYCVRRRTCLVTSELQIPSFSVPVLCVDQLSEQQRPGIILRQPQATAEDQQQAGKTRRMVPVAAEDHPMKVKKHPSGREHPRCFLRLVLVWSLVHYRSTPSVSAVLFRVFVHVDARRSQAMEYDSLSGIAEVQCWVYRKA